MCVLLLWCCVLYTQDLVLSERRMREECEDRLQSAQQEASAALTQVCVCVTFSVSTAGQCHTLLRSYVCVFVFSHIQHPCVSIGLTEHTDRGLARVGLTNQDRTKQAYRGRKAYPCVCVCVCCVVLCCIPYTCAAY